MAVFKDHYEIISKSTENNNCPSPLDVELNENQMLAEYFILCNALQLAGNEFDLTPVPLPVIDRVIKAIVNQDVELSGFGVWLDDAEQANLEISSPLLDKKQFTKGFYTRKKLVAQLSEVFQPSELIAVANQNWKRDWRMLKCIGANVLHVNQYQQMFHLVNMERADILPLTFGSQNDLNRSVFGVTLYPVEGIKMTFEESSHYAVFGKSELGQKLLDSINTGMAILKQKGVLQLVYQDLGIINSATANWQTINCR